MGKKVNVSFRCCNAFKRRTWDGDCTEAVENPPLGLEGRLDLDDAALELLHDRSDLILRATQHRRSLASHVVNLSVH